MPSEESLEIQVTLAHEAKNYYRWIYAQAATYLGQCVLEVGCAVGNFTEFLVGTRRVVAMDIDDVYVQWVRRRFSGDPSLTVWQGDLRDPAWLVGARDWQFDTVVCLNVLEHVEDDLRALDHLYHALSPRGRLILLVPAFMVLYGAMDRADGHFRRYRKRELRAKLNRAGFVITRLYYMNALGFFGWLVNGRVLKERVVSPEKVRRFDRLVPVCSWLEARLRPPFGQSLVAICEKR